MPPAVVTLHGVEIHVWLRSPAEASGVFVQDIVRYARPQARLAPPRPPLPPHHPTPPHAALRRRAITGWSPSEASAFVADKRGELVHGAKGTAPRSLLEEYASPTSSQPPPATVRAGADLSELCQVIHKKAAGTGRPKRETKRWKERSQALPGEVAAALVSRLARLGDGAAGAARPADSAHQGPPKKRHKGAAQPAPTQEHRAEPVVSPQKSAPEPEPPAQREASEEEQEQEQEEEEEEVFDLSMMSDEEGAPAAESEPSRPVLERKDSVTTTAAKAELLGSPPPSQGTPMGSPPAGQPSPVGPSQVRRRPEAEPEQPQHGGAEEPLQLELEEQPVTEDHGGDEDHDHGDAAASDAPEPRVLEILARRRLHEGGEDIEYCVRWSPGRLPPHVKAGANGTSWLREDDPLLDPNLRQQWELRNAPSPTRTSSSPPVGEGSSGASAAKPVVVLGRGASGGSPTGGDMMISPRSLAAHDVLKPKGQ